MEKQQILIAGSSGLLGSHLCDFLQKQGYQVGRLLRQPHSDHPHWHIQQKNLQLKQFATPEIVINLSGENIAAGRWSRQKKQRLLSSRLDSTELLSKHFSKQHAPALFINASAIGFYGNRHGIVLDEESTQGDDFVSELSAQWEQKCNPIKSDKTRLALLRTGIVLTAQGGALKKMLPAFKLGLGGKIGSGYQVMSWIDIDDWCRAVLFIIQNPQLNGAINLVAPTPVCNLHFSQALAKQLQRPCKLPIPQFIIKLLFGEMGKELLLSSTEVVPKKLLNNGFEFLHRSITSCLQNQIK